MDTFLNPELGEKEVSEEAMEAGLPEAPRLSELRMVLFGRRWTGKSSAGNTILGRRVFETGRETTDCITIKGDVAGRLVTVVDTPGWNMIKLTPEMDKQAIVQSVSLCPPGPHAILLVIPVGLFSEDYLSVLEEHMKLFSERAWRHTVVLFTWGDSLGDSAIEQHIERQGKTLRQLIEKCGHRYHVLNNRTVGDHTQVTALLEKIEGMVAANGGHHYEDDEKIFLPVGSIQEQRKEPESVKLLRRRDSKELVYPTMDREQGDSPDPNCTPQLTERQDSGTTSPCRVL